MDGQEPAPYDRWSRPEALSRRGYLVVALVPVLIAAVGFAVVSLVASDDPSLSGTTVRLPTSDWQPGDGGDSALIQGALRLDDEHCVYLELNQERTYAVWPAGWRATREGEALTLYDADENPVANDGDMISTQTSGARGYGVTWPKPAKRASEIQATSATRTPSDVAMLHSITTVPPGRWSSSLPMLYCSRPCSLLAGLISRVGGKPLRRRHTSHPSFTESSRNHERALTCCRRSEASGQGRSALSGTTSTRTRRRGSPTRLDA